MKKSRFHVSYHIAVFVFIFLAFLLLLAIALSPFASIIFEDVFTKWDIDNPHVNGGFSGWQTAAIAPEHSFSIPGNWTIQCADKVYTLVDDSGKEWARGAMYGTESDIFESYKDFASTFAHIQADSTTVDPCSDYAAMKGGDIDRLILHGADSEEAYYFIELTRASGPTFVLFVFEDIAESPEDYDIAEAILYSFAYL